jgi:prepilin-type N-terminal cleavage/methylation domain-containing protein/prepilin-type processing-associated H-X9-DG protein
MKIFLTVTQRSDEDGERCHFKPKAVGNSPNRFQQGFTLVELLVVIAIIATLAAIATLSSQRMIANAASTKCVSNLRQIGTAMGTYVTENSGKIPYSNDPNTIGFSHWTAPLPKLLDVGEGSVKFPLRTDYDKATAVHPFNCPTCKTKFRTYAANMNAMCFLGQGGNYALRNMSSAPNLAALVLLADDTQADPAPKNNGKGVFDSSSFVSQIGVRHNGKANMLFADFHIESRARESLTPTINLLPKYN